ncbi:putative bifunctional diguanylate cyclase/phosphodiesterase [Acetobacterium malicum]|uniref:putative bifunctional diguanylate cyclase/phosphodiesterase n=1 Tax=Acetobacterium malicum TaxID=52692 RepID=UPI000686CD63|nr:EAL domain-containing protein [Acetobacterium dehalogenans]
MMAMLGPMLLIAAAVSVSIGFYWQESLPRIVKVSGTLFFCGVFILILLYQKLPHRLALHLMSIALLFGLLATYLAYYERLTFIFWMIILIMIIMSNMMIERTLFYYMLFAVVLSFGVSLFYYPVLSVQMDQAFTFTLLVVFLFIIVASIVTNRIYQLILQKKTAMHAKALIQNENLSQLYDDVLAHQQQLKAQNELLVHYNSEIEENQERLEFLAYTDTLTGIPNRKMLLEQIELLIDLNRENSHRFALVFIDLDNFKKINDSMGHSAGDDLLIQVTTRLKNAMHEKDLLGRLGGDELAVLIRRQISDEGLLGYTQNLLNLLGNPLKLGDKSVIITASFGIAIWPLDAKNSGDLLKAADTAMYKAKELGKNSIQFYQKEMKTEVLYKMELENRMLEAYEKEEFFVEYQPIVNALDKKTVSFEALLRWKVPGRGLVSPAEFIPLAEEIGLIGELGEWVLRQACKKIIEIRNSLKMEIRIAVNVSAVQMKRPDFLEGIKSVIREEGVSPESLTFEITESVFIGNMEQAIEIIKELKDFGVMISLDDFGTGYSSLSYLMQLPIDVLKIDRSFINSIEKEEKNNRIVGSIIEMVHSLDIHVVAEGVEEILQFDFLKAKNCDSIQGYLLSRPLGDIAMAAHLKEQRDQK